MRRRGFVAVLASVVALAWPGHAHAQAPRLLVPAESLGFLTSFNYQFQIETIGTDDPQFCWVGHFGGDFDVIGGPKGRGTVSFDYEPVMGNELQPFDPNQGNYAIELYGAGRIGEFEIGGRFHHTSRHLGDRAKDFGIAWNVMGPQVAWTRIRDRYALQVRAQALKGLLHDYVDYSGEYSSDVVYRLKLGRTTALVTRAEALARTVDRDVSNRGTQTGGRAEIGVRIAGRAAALEIFTGIERRIDASALLAQPMTWGFTGIRILNPE